MTSNKSAIVALTIALVTSVAHAAEVVWPRESASDFSLFVVLQRHRLYADHCSARLPQLTPKLQSLMQDLDRRIQAISKALLASGAYSGMMGRPVPAVIIFGFEDALHDAEHNLERQDAVLACQRKIQALGELDDEALAMDLSNTFTAVQKMIDNMEALSAPKASPE